MTIKAPQNDRTLAVDIRATATSRLRGVLTVISGPETGRTMPIPPGQDVSLGRGEGCSYRFDDVSMSGTHARVIRVGDAHMFVDLGSRNGSFINDTRVTAPTPLRDGDRIQVGSATFLRFSLADDANGVSEPLATSDDEFTTPRVSQNAQLPGSPFQGTASLPVQGARRWPFAVVALLVIGTIAWFRLHKGGPAAPGPSTKPVPVVTTAVQQRDVPVYVEGLGAASPLNTTTVKTQVDGRLDQVFFKEGQSVKKGALLAQIDPRPFAIQLHNAQAALARDTAQLTNARLNRDRYQQLRKDNLIPEQQLTDQQALVQQNTATIATDQAAIESARLNLDYAHITSPIDGVTGVRLVDPGNIIHAADPGGIVIITQLDPMAVVFTLPEDDLPRVAKYLAEGTIPVDAFNRDGTMKLATGKLGLVDNEVNATTATIRLKAFFPNPDNTLWPNEFVKARALLYTQPNAVVIPSAGANRGPQGTFAYVVGPDNTVALRSIEIDTTQGEFTLLKSGLSPGEQVVIDGQSQLRPGSKVSPQSQDKVPAASAGASSQPGASGAGAGQAPGAPR